MRSFGLISLLGFAAASCGTPIPANLAIRGSASASIRVHVPPPPPPPPAVELESETVVEFFGVPLEGAQDVIFVLDLSGSMNDAALGQIAQLAPPKTAPKDPSIAPSGMTYGVPPPPGAPPPPNAPPPGAPPPPNAPPPGAPVQAGPVYTTPRKIEVAQQELVAALERLPAGTRMNVLFFNDGLEAFARELVPLQEADRAGLIDFVQRARATGSTALAPALRTAFVLNARRVILLSDGLGNIGGNSDSVLRDAREAMQGGVRIDAIGIGPDHDRNLMRTLATESGGLYQPL